MLLMSCRETSRGCHYMVPVCASSCIQVISSSVVVASATSRAFVRLMTIKSINNATVLIHTTQYFAYLRVALYLMQHIQVDCVCRRRILLL